MISPQIGGWVQQLHAVEGESVQAGDPLVELDPRLAQSALARASAVVADHSSTPVVTVIRAGQAYEVEVETGVETRQRIEIRKGLSPGDTVATSGGYGLPDGCPVQIIAEPLTAAEGK